MRYYQLDLNKVVYSGEMTFRRFIVLLKGLPGESAWQRFLQDKNNYSLANYNPQKLGV